MKITKKHFLKLYAGLGNQLFQYSYGKYLEKQGYSVEFIQKTVKNDLSELFQVNAVIHREKSNFIIICRKIIAKYLYRSYLTGFYQDYFFPEQLEQNELPVFKNKQQFMNTDEYKQISSTESVSIHIRGGDYLEDINNTYGNICTQSYYVNAIKIIIDYCKNNTKRDPVFFVFTNDKVFANKILSCIDIVSFIIVNNQVYNTPDFDLFLMSSCKHNIIANSTFSWWAAFLNSNKNKKVLTPSKWTNNDNTIIDKLIPLNWTKL